MKVERLPEMIKILLEEVRISPSRLAKLMRSDLRTINKALKVLEKLTFVKYEELIISGKNYRVYFLVPKWREFFEKVLK